ncbi:MAG TPA: acyl-CoA dehydrogenase family protein [Nocardioidaceae bacterium]|nr:acyl-CoA dehydrogenase family protein [Nocardioidaceae bacterium]
MSQFGLSTDQQAYVAHVRDLADKELSPDAQGLRPDGSDGHVDRELLRTLGRLGLLRGLFGGAPDETPRDAAAMQLCLLRETLAGVNTEAETALALQGLGSYPILQSGNRSTVERWLPGVVSGEVVAAFALSEPDAGSDAAALSLRAEPDGDPSTGARSWRLFGEKTWISNAPEADVYTVFARTTPDSRARGVTAFAVAGDADGLSGEHIDLLSPHAIGRLTFDGVRVTSDDILGEVDAGFTVAMRTLDLFRPSVGAFALGMAQAALDATVAWTGDRQVHGGPLHEQQSVSHTLAEMATRVRASRLLVYAAASAYDAGAPAAEVTTAAAMAKLYATESAQYVVDQAVQLHGARALQRGHLLEHLYREVRAPRIYEGASEVQRTIIGRGLVRDHEHERPEGDSLP